MKSKTWYVCIATALALFSVCGKSNPANNDLTAPVITQQPYSWTVTAGKSVTFTVIATGNPTPSYQWRKNDTNISGTSGSYQISSVQFTDSGTYSVVVSNSEGSVTSKRAVLIVIATDAPAGMVSIPGGTFQMGSNDTTNYYFYDERPVHSVTVSAFYMDTTEVTQEDYLALMGVNPSYFTGYTMRPVDQVTWFDAVLYCNARSKRDGLDTLYSYIGVTGTPGNGCIGLTGLDIDFTKSGYRLPTEAEWEYACRAGTTTDYYWNRNYPLTTLDDTLARDSNVVFGATTWPVASKKPNAFGLYDMIGNVWEWCNDWYGSYSSGNQTDPTGPLSGTYRVLRGGLWDSGDDNLRSAYRKPYFPDFSMNIFPGFRCVRR